MKNLEDANNEVVAEPKELQHLVLLHLVSLGLLDVGEVFGLLRKEVLEHDELVDDSFILVDAGRDQDGRNRRANKAEVEHAMVLRDEENFLQLGVVDGLRHATQEIEQQPREHHGDGVALGCGDLKRLVGENPVGVDTRRVNERSQLHSHVEQVGKLVFAEHELGVVGELSKERRRDKAAEVGLAGLALTSVDGGDQRPDVRKVLGLQGKQLAGNVRHVSRNGELDSRAGENEQIAEVPALVGRDDLGLVDGDRHVVTLRCQCNHLRVEVNRNAQTLDGREMGLKEVSELLVVNDQEGGDQVGTGHVLDEGLRNPRLLRDGEGVRTLVKALAKLAENRKELLGQELLLLVVVEDAVNHHDGEQHRHAGLARGHRLRLISLGVHLRASAVHHLLEKVRLIGLRVRLISRLRRLIHRLATADVNGLGDIDLGNAKAVQKLGDLLKNGVLRDRFLVLQLAELAKSHLGLTRLGLKGLVTGGRVGGHG